MAAVFHRYQIESAGKAVGGMEFQYTVRGDANELQVPPETRVFAARSPPFALCFAPCFAPCFARAHRTRGCGRSNGIPRPRPGPSVPA